MLVAFMISGHIPGHIRVERIAADCATQNAQVRFKSERIYTIYKGHITLLVEET